MVTEHDGSECNSIVSRMRMTFNQATNEHEFYFPMVESPDEAIEDSYESPGQDGEEQLGQFRGLDRSNEVDSRREDGQYDESGRRSIQFNNGFRFEETNSEQLSNPYAVDNNGRESISRFIQDIKVLGLKFTSIGCELQGDDGNQFQYSHNPPPDVRASLKSMSERKRHRQLSKKLESTTKFALRLGTLLQKEQALRRDQEMTAHELQNVNMELNLQISIADSTTRTLRAKVEDLERELEERNQNVLLLDEVQKKYDALVLEYERRNEEEKQKIQEIEKRSHDLKAKLDR
ncbi:hypothetical protein BC829DRAFT_434255 [Chytridium lagenaria]|nr:hypothetical protein BC829DRAFT_434255 [Chytridium lagenaria]